ncbi:MAG: TonB family protein [Acidobacteriota bacterium]
MLSTSSQWAEAFWVGMAVHLWQTTLVLAVLALLERLLASAPARFHARLWWVGLLKLLLPVPLIAPAVRWLGTWLGTVGVPPGTWAVTTRWTVLSLLLDPSGWGQGVIVASSISSAGLFYPMLTLAWLLGVVTVLALWVRRTSTRANDLCAVPFAPEPARSKLRAALAGTGVEAGSVFLTGSRVVPCVLGIRRPSLLVPERVVEELSVEELRSVIFHEEAHRRRREALRSFVAALTLALFFFYPPAWLLVWRLNSSAEFICDEHVLRSGLAPDTYARAIARILHANLFPATASAIIGRKPSLLAARLDRIQQSGRYLPMSRHRLAIAAAILVVVLFSTLPTFSLERGAAGQRELPGADTWMYPALDSLANGDMRINLEYRGADTATILDEIARMADLRLVYEGPRPYRQVTLTASNVSLKEALALLASKQDRLGFWYEVPEPGLLVVRVSGNVAQIGGSIRPPEKLVDVAPEYPEAARRAGLQGVVILRALIDERGTVGSLDVIRGLGTELDGAAIDAVSKWRYQPLLVGEVAVPVLLTVTVQFALSKQGTGVRSPAG